ncbi:MAG: FKBP-type peptidyl-prolyl cis-trans isomerase [Desulfobacterales bacterium]|nr:FKBP-type peptidyl-prolyl cis-trans isomerase [Desulfobacterales bacterium]MDP6681530.1 FKBP-type peptidyl-prolyl cis-trans isomerase [Desulfobacterales bacterium]MDP6806851.1 FKBP-type peptidyl-prolyl cis-trans isomerase [Desulfobacterales bacterium]
MKTNFIFSIYICSLFLFINNSDAFAENETAKPFEKHKNKVSYIIGTNIAKSLENFKEEIELDMLIDGIKDQFNKKTLRVAEEESESVMRKFSAKMNKRQSEKNKLLAKEAMEVGNKFLEENRKKKGVVTTESGLQYLILKQGDGPKPEKTDKVKVHYRGTTIDGVEFDSSYKRGKPALFPVTGVIKGWIEALLLMNVGSKYKLFIPPELAYGSQGAGPRIGPNAVLIFEIELLDIER